MHTTNAASPTVAPTGPGPLIILGLPLALQVVAMYVLVGVETPLTPVVRKVMERPAGVFVLSAMGLVIVCVVMMTVLTWIERRHRKSAQST
jgi:hypothetical protein